MTTSLDQQQDFDLGRRLTAITMGIDTLERQVSKGEGALDSEGLVPIYLGGDLVETKSFKNWGEVLESVEDLSRDVAGLPQGPRKMFLSAMVRSLRAASTLFSGGTLSFQEKLTDLVGVPAGPVAEGTVEDIHDRLDSLLRAKGVTQGSLEERVRNRQDDLVVDKKNLPKVFEELMAVARARTNDMIWDTGAYTMALNPVSGVPYTARCNFNEGKMDLNLDLAFTRQNIKHLVCHEVFPGHSTQLIYTREEAAAGRATPDVLLCTANGVTGCVQEGIGDQGVELIDWIEDADDEIQVQLRRLNSAVATNAAWYLMGENWAEEKVASYLSDKAFGQPAWVTGRIRLARHPFRGAFIASYWFGNEAVRIVRERTKAADRPAFISFLYGHMHSPESLQLFKAA
jgi:hypothetical protein